MSKYIDADAVLELIREEFHKTDVNGEEQMGVLKCHRIVREAPTVDVVEVVRCRDCKHNVANWQHDELDIEDYTDIVCDYFMTDGMEANDYCSHGERREE